jgi:hypothetical protein
MTDIQEFKCLLDVLKVRYEVRPYNVTSGCNYAKYDNDEPCEMRIALRPVVHPDTGWEIRIYFLIDGAFHSIKNPYRPSEMSAPASEVDFTSNSPLA